MNEKAQRIARLNDEFRKTGQGGHITKTQGVAALPVGEQARILNMVQSFNDFSEANDPYGEHDFGRIEHNGNILYWKIDYHDTDLECGSENPADPEKTIRVMTVMLAHEY
jgi:Protein of unknown function (DUF3768)